MKFTILFLLMIPFCGYSQDNVSVPAIRKHHTGDVYRIDVYGAYREKAGFSLSRIADDIVFIPLETTDECLLDLKGQMFVVMTREDIFIFDYIKGYRFDINGKFVNSIGTKGQGPGEFIRSMAMDVDTVNRRVYFLDDRRIVEYDYDGKHIETFPTGFSASSLLILDVPGQFVIDYSYYQFAKPKERFSMYFYSKKEKKPMSRFSCDYNEKVPGMAMCFPIAYRFNNSLYLKDYWSDTIYVTDGIYDANSYAVVQKGRLIHRNVPDRTLVKGGKASPEDSFILEVTKIRESSRYIFLLTNKGIVIFDKKENRTWLDEFREFKIDIENDLYGGSLHCFPSKIEGDRAILYAHPDQLIISGNHRIRDERYDRYRNMAGKIDMEDNPVLMIIKLKK